MPDHEPSPRHCLQCGKVVPSGLPGGFCPDCLLPGGRGSPVDDGATVAMPPGPSKASSSGSDAPRPAPAGPPSSGTGPSGPGRSPSPEDLQHCFPQLEIGELLGAGGMGAVYRARQPRLNRTVALKVLSCPVGLAEDFALRFEREAQVMARLDHPNIVTIHDFGEVDGSALGQPRLFYFLMEHVDGADLHRLIRSGELDIGRILALVPQICDALQYAHDEGIAHRDIKPANLLVDRKGRVKIADFGLAKLMQGDETLAMGLTLTGTAMGTPHYMAPEQWETPETVDHRADIYSLGVVLYELLTGERPVGSFRLPSEKCGVDPGIDTVVLRAMEGDPTKRFQQVCELSTAFAEVVASPAKPAKKPLLWIAAGLVALAGIGGAVLWKEGSAGTPARNESGDAATPPVPASTADKSVRAPVTDPSQASKERPFVNSLGMKFVPVPGTEVLFCIHETRYKDYAAYAEENPGGDGAWKVQSLGSNFIITDRPEDHPMWKSSWEDAKAFCEWISQKEGRTYRLPTDAEWSIAVGLGGKEQRSPDDTPDSLNGRVVDEYPWGTEWPPPAGTGNFSDQSRKEKAPNKHDPKAVHLDHDDGFPTTAPVMSFPPNAFGLHDMAGNMAEWVEDWINAEQKLRVIRGSAWSSTSSKGMFRSSMRVGVPPDSRAGASNGFRLVLVPDAPPAMPPKPEPPTTTAPKEASKERPFENSLGMKFVPVPGTDVLFCIHETRYKDYVVYGEGSASNIAWRDQSSDGFAITDQNEDHPVWRMSWHQAQDFCHWLSRKEGHRYRLPNDREWSQAVGIGDLEKPQPGDTPKTLGMRLDGIYPWGAQWPPPPGVGNLSDRSRRNRAYAPKSFYLDDYEDGFPLTSPVMSFPPNRFGIHDLEGNLVEWVEDWYSEQQDRRTIRGGCFGAAHGPMLKSSGRMHHVPTDNHSYCGFRIVLDPAPEPTK